MVLTRDQAEANSYLWPDGTVPYSQTTGYPRHDCSGYVGNLCWAILPPVSTVTLVTSGWMYEIPFADRKKGDAFGHCGPNTEGNAGHIQLYLYDTATGLYIAEQSGGPPGPRHHAIKSLAPGYKTYRFTGITDGPVTTGDIDMYLIRAKDSGTFLFTGTYRIYVSSPAREAEMVKKLGPVQEVGDVTEYGVEWTNEEFYHYREVLGSLPAQISNTCGGGGGGLPEHEHHAAPQTGGVIS